jgi:hypothetical protein
MTEARRPAEPRQRESPAAGMKLPSSTARRICHQIDRSVQGTYGANDGLHQLVQLGTQQLLAAGASREVIRSEMIRCVSERAPADMPEPALSRHKALMASLTELMIGWADECPLAPVR